MCGRFTLRTSPRAVADSFQLTLLPDLAPRYNIAPTQSVATIRRQESASPRELTMLHWGLVPRWADDPSVASRMINARAESLADKPAFREAFRKRRCLVVTDGFYEWRKEGKQKQPFLMSRPDGGPFAFAGLWESWRRGELAIDSCTIVTTTANGLLRELHERMPVILSPSDYDAWLDPEQQDVGALQPLLAPAPEDWLVKQPVSTLVNSAGVDQPECAQPFIVPKKAEQGMLF